MTAAAGELAYQYSAFGMAIRSAIALPELEAGGTGEDFRIELAPHAESVETHSIAWRDGEATFRYPKLGQFCVSRGRQLLITPDPRADASLYRLYVEGMMLAAALAQRGQFVLHASSVSVGPDAIAFLGPVGAGKSTFAAALCSQGRMLMADDNTAVAIEGGTPVVTPAFPSVKVYPKIAQSLGAEPRSLRPMHVSQVKEAQPVAAFSVERRKLRCLYVLDRAAQSGPARLTPVETVTELIRNSVPTRWGLKGDGRHLATCALLARKVPAFRVRTFRELSEIPGIASAIERHAVCAGI